MSEAQSLGLITSATNVFGFGESIENRVEHMHRIRELQDSSLEKYSNGFTSFISWPVQLENNTYGKRNRGRNKFELGAGPTEYLRHVAFQDFSLTISNIFKHHGQLWDYLLLRWHFWEERMMQVPQ